MDLTVLSVEPVAQSPEVLVVMVELRVVRELISFFLRSMQHQHFQLLVQAELVYLQMAGVEAEEQVAQLQHLKNILFMVNPHRLVVTPEVVVMAAQRVLLLDLPVLLGLQPVQPRPEVVEVMVEVVEEEVEQEAPLEELEEMVEMDLLAELVY
jgi:hypothetical protein